MLTSVGRSKTQFHWRRRDETPPECIEDRLGGERIEMVNTGNSVEAFSMKRDQRNRKITGRLMG